MYETSAYINSLNRGKITPTETAKITVLERSEITTILWTTMA